MSRTKRFVNLPRVPLMRQREGFHGGAKRPAPSVRAALHEWLEDMEADAKELANYEEVEFDYLFNKLDNAGGAW